MQPKFPPAESYTQTAYREACKNRKNEVIIKALETKSKKSNISKNSSPPSQSFGAGEGGPYRAEKMHHSTEIPSGGVGSNNKDLAQNKPYFQPSEEEREIAIFLSNVKGSKSASGPEVGERADSSLTSPLGQSEVSQKREISETPNDSEYYADNSRSPSPSPRQSKKIRLGSPQIGNEFG